MNDHMTMGVLFVQSNQLSRSVTLTNTEYAGSGIRVQYFICLVNIPVFRSGPAVIVTTIIVDKEGLGLRAVGFCHSPVEESISVTKRERLDDGLDGGWTTHRVFEGTTDHDLFVRPSHHIAPNGPMVQWSNMKEIRILEEY